MNTERIEPSTSLIDKLRTNGATTCKFWLTHNLWTKELPIESPPQKGKEVVHFFISHAAAPEVKEAFIFGWDAYLEDPAFLG